MDRTVLEPILKHLESPEASFQISASIDRPGWRLVVNGAEICTLSEIEKNAIMAPCKDYQQADQATRNTMMTKTLDNVRAFVRSLLEAVADKTIQETNPLDCLVAEKLMNWTTVPEKFSCSCACYRAANGDIHYVSKIPARPCTIHKNWSPSTNLQDAQLSLFEKLFNDSNGAQIAIVNVNASYKQGEGMKTTIKFRNAARTETFEVTEIQAHPAAAVCIAALRLAGIDGLGSSEQTSWTRDF